MQQIYSKKSFVIYRVRDGYIVHNKEKPFKEGHTHITNINTAKYIINISINKKLPEHLTDYLMESLIRLSIDRDFAIKVENLRKIRKKGKENVKKMNFGEALEAVKSGKGMRLPQWKPDVVIRAQYPDENSKMTAPYLYVESRFGRVPWKETMIELFAENWEVVE